MCFFDLKADFSEGDYLKELLSFIGERFSVCGNIYSYEKINNGLINESFKVVYSDNENTHKAFLFQRINRNAFADFTGVMSNISKVTAYLKQRCPDEKTLDFYASVTGENFFETDEGSVWRVSDWIESVVLKTTDDISYIKEAGRAYGHFLKNLSMFDINTLSYTVPGFHNTKNILDRFLSVVQEQNRTKTQGAEREIEYLCSEYNKLTSVCIAYEEGKVPLRVVHNDTKLSNVLFSVDSCRAEAVIDLDTVMPGMSVYDFGDAVRSASGAVESRTGEVSFDTEKFKAFSEGFLSETEDILTKAELDLLVPAAYSVTAELSARYFTDYFTDGHYFKVSSSEELLAKAVSQARLSEMIMKQSDTLSEIILALTNQIKNDKMKFESAIL